MKLLLKIIVVFCCMVVFSISGVVDARRINLDDDDPPPAAAAAADDDDDGRGGRRRRCEEAYVVGEEETLQTISVKCDNLFILEDNPAINDADDIGKGMVLYMRPVYYSTSTPAPINLRAKLHF